MSFLEKNRNTSFKLSSLLKKLGLKQHQRAALKKQLNQLTRENKIFKDKKYYTAQSAKSVTGKKAKTTFQGEMDFGSDGRLILRNSDSGEVIKNFKTAADSSLKLNVKDKVEFRISDVKSNSSEKSAEVIRVLNSGKIFVTGKFENHGSYGIVFPDSKNLRREIIISAKHFLNAKNEDKVYAEILNPEALVDEYSDVRGKINEILGKSGDRSSEEKSIMRKYNLVREFPEQVEREANELKIKFNPKDRLDLRSKIIFTIDPEDAKDFDDAVSVEKLEDGTYMLGVHIADVSHFVKENTELDKTAMNRGTSVYLVKNVVPMLPEKLSNDICSLKQDEDRLTFSIFIHLSKRFALKDFRINKSVIRSKKRFTYENAQKIIDTKKGDFAEELLLMYKISKSITIQRLKDESLDFDSNEVKFQFNKKGDVTDIVVKERLDSMRLIEEFMLLANKCATLFIKNLSKENKIHYPFIYRVHDIPNKDKMKELADFVEQFGYKINIDDKNSLRKLLKEIEGKPEEFIINNLLIRSMAKAIYTTKNIGHYGLGFKDYTHFTSPIRRYPDLIVHRLLHKYISNTKNLNKEIENYKTILPEICKHSSITEQNAEAAERESIKLMQADYISKHIGEEYEGIISGIVQYGMFVEIMDILIEGMIRFRDIADDYYEYNEKKHIVVGRRYGRTFRAGQKVKIRVIRVNKESRKIDFELVKKKL